MQIVILHHPDPLRRESLLRKAEYTHQSSDTSKVARTWDSCRLPDQRTPSGFVPTS